MKKSTLLIKILIILIILCIILMAFGSKYSVSGYSNDNRNKIYGYVEKTKEETEKLNVEYTLKENENVKVVQNLSSVATNGQYSILNQPNVWCVQHGAKLEYAEYSVTADYKSRDPVLDYIIATGPKMGTLQEDWRSDSQKALWKYFGSGGDFGTKHDDDKTDKTDKGIILDGITCGTFSEESAIYKEALDYKNKVNGNATLSITEQELDENGDKINVTIKVGNSLYDNLKYYIDGKEVSLKNLNETFNQKEQVYTITGYFDISNINKSTVKIEVKSSITKYDVKYKLLKNNDNQRLLVATEVNNTITTYDDSKEIFLKTDISLQKYIVKVNNTDISGRNNKKTSENENNSRIVKDGSYKNIYKDFNNNKNVSPANSYKRNNAVQIEAGDNVTYRIYVYNNSNVNAKNVTVTDRLPFYYTSSDTNFETGNKDVAVSIEEKDITIKDKNGKTISYTNKNDNTTYGCTNLSWTIGQLDAKSATYFDITLKFDKYLTGIIHNTAWISSTEPTNKRTYRTLDREYVQMKNYSVSLEKYVSAINGNNIGDSNYDTRYDINNDGKIDSNELDFIRDYISKYDYNTGNSSISYPEGKTGDFNNDESIDLKDVILLEQLLQNNSGNIIPKREYSPIHNNDNDQTTWNDYKYNNVVTVSNGDTVTYTIKVKNDGDTKVTIKNIADYFPNGVEYNGTKYTGDVYCTKFDKEKLNNGQTGNKVNFSNEIALEPGESKSFTVQVTVTEPNISNNILKNVAEIPEDGLENKNGVSITDTTLNNNKDADYIQLDYTKPTNKTTSFTVEKQWRDNNNSNNTRPDSIIVGLYRENGELLSKVTSDANGNKIENITLNSNNKWTYTWNNLPKTDANGKNITYYAKELRSDNTVILNSGDENGNYIVNYIESSNKTTIINITETPQPETTSYTVEKNWVLNGNNKLDSVSVKLIKIKDKEEIDLGKETITLSDNNNWTYKWNDLPILENGWRYAVRELSKDGKTLLSGGNKYNENIIVDYVDNDNETIITNTIYKETTSFVVEKVWQDNNNSNNTRPDSIIVGLYRENGELLSKVTSDANGNKIENITLNSNNKWTYTWNNLPKTDTNGNNITYYAKELRSDNTVIVNSGDENGAYSVTYNDNSHKTIIINTLEEPETTYYIVEKNWVLNGNAMPDSVSVKLIKIKDKEEIDLGKETITLSDNNNWTYIWNDLPILENGWRYAVRELSEDGKTLLSGGKKYNNSTTVDYLDNTDKTTITNTIKETTSFTVEKVWEDNENSNETRPTSIQVRLYKNNDEIVTEDANSNKIEDITLNNSNWTYTWYNLPKTDEYGNNIIYYARELKEEKKAFSSSLIPVKEGEAYDENYKVSYINASDKTLIKNIKTTPDKTSFTVKKVWQDNNNSNRPTSIQVRLYKNNGEIVTSDANGDKIEDITLSSGNWTYTWNNLQKIDANGNNITYYAIEKINGQTIENDGKFAYYIKNNNIIYVDTTNENKVYEYTVNYIHEPEQTTIYNSMEETPPPPDEDEDYAIGGIVWNDIAPDKNNVDYNGKKDSYEDYLSGITVKLHRYYIKNNILENKGIVATTTTNENGEYRFTNDDLISSLQKEERYIKGPKENGTNRWTGGYYSYYVIFEYDGITYTSTTYTEFNAKKEDGTILDTALKSNAEENKNTRTTFNNQFSTINSASAINYATVNEEGYIPQSKHIYNSLTMAMQSSTILINLKKDKITENNLKHVNLGLRGRDIFDLELTSDVYSTKVTVNGVDGTYNYSNKVTVRRNDLSSSYNYREDFANTYAHAQESEYKGQSHEQKIRETDIVTNAYGKDNEQTGLAIEVTYKITVKNASNTNGTATKVTNYYDNRYTFKKAYSDSGDLGTTDGGTGTGYKSVVITTPDTQLNQSETMDIYVVYTLNNPVGLLSKNSILATYNMAEITEYTTSCGEGQTEFTRGLLDKDSAPGSANKEQVRLTTTEGQNTATTDGNPTTVQYYFSGNDLSKLKYEDDTYATPTLYFVKDGNERTITGTVFEDKTTTDETTRIKTGNGIMDSGEVGVYGATVQLIELPNNNLDYNRPDENKLSHERIITTTDSDGKFKLSGFLPGNYIIRYSYGDTISTVLLNQNSEGVNGKSYNGEDFQATNNTGKYGAEELDKTENYWYINNEMKGVSTATDDKTRRIEVSDNVILFTDEQMTVFNDIRGGATEVENIKDIIEKTSMWANTNAMKFEVEKGYSTASNGFDGYKITNMNFGIAEVPVTTIDLTKSLNKFTITDSTGQNVIASFEPGKTKGDVMTAKDTGGDYWVQIEDEKLQGARLEITYNINLDMTTERNFDNTASTVPTITGIVDFIDNNLSYNPALGDNDKYWEVTTYQEILEEFAEMKYKDGTTPRGIVDPDGKKYTTIVKAKKDNRLLLTNTGKATAPITLEKVLSSTNSTIEEIITSTVDSFEYSNIVEIIGFDYTNTTISNDGNETPDPQPSNDDNFMRDRVRTKYRYIILPGVQHDSATSETLVITPPTGDSSISITYYIIAVISLAVLAVGVFGIKKFVIKK